MKSRLLLLGVLGGILGILALMSGLAIALEAGSKQIAYILQRAPVYIERNASSHAAGYLAPHSWYRVRATKVEQDGVPWVGIVMPEDGAINWVEQRYLVIRDELISESPQRLLDILAKKPWPETTKAKILEGTIDLAMTEEQLKLAWGTPTKIEEEVIDQAGLKNKAKKYCYGPYVVYVVNGIVARIP
jgi:hypothetical protein